jgi:hypothetical protein
MILRIPSLSESSDRYGFGAAARNFMNTHCVAFFEALLRHRISATYTVWTWKISGSHGGECEDDSLMVHDHLL